MLDDWERVVPLKPGIERAVRNVVPIARRFMFDPEACAHVGRLLFEAADLVAEQIVFAKPPYDYTYLELSDARAMFRGWRPTESNNPKTSDNKLGLLYSKNRLYTFCSSDTTDIPTTIGMFCVDIGHGQTEPLTELYGDGALGSGVEISGQSRLPGQRTWQDWVKLGYLLGGMRQRDGVLMVQADYDYFLNNYDLRSTIAPPAYLDRHRRHQTMFEASYLGGGDILIGAACLLLIHGQRRGVSVRSVGPERGWFKGKRRVYHKHGVVQIKLGPHDTMRKVVFGVRESPIRHDVMGTWAHYHRDPQCDHDWTRLEDPEHERYRCSKCPTLRTWRMAHVRGQGGKGIKTKTYSVTE